MSTSADIAKVHLRVRRGDTKTWTIVVTDKNGVPKDITLWKFAFTVKKSLADIDDDAVLAKDITVHYEPLAGKTQIKLTSAETARLGIYKYDVQAQYPGAEEEEVEVRTIMEGSISFYQDCTQRIIDAPEVP